MGAGAVGCYFGGMLARAGAPVTLIGRAALADAVGRDGLFIDSFNFQQRIPVKGATEPSAAGDAAIVLLSVKTLNTESAAKSLAAHLRPDALVLSMQNGVDNVERIRVATGIDAVPVAVYVAASMTEAARVKHVGRGDLVIGDMAKDRRDGGARRAQLEQVAALFTRAGVPCRISANVEAELWSKLVMNCAYNAISALSRVKYGRIAANPWTLEVMKQAVAECVAVGCAAGVPLSVAELIAAGLKLGAAMTEAVSSTAQDIARGKRTEIDSLNGYVARRGAALGVPAPVNQTLHALVKLLEEGN